MELNGNLAAGKSILDTSPSLPAIVTIRYSNLRCDCCESLCREADVASFGTTEMARIASIDGIGRSQQHGILLHMGYSSTIGCAES